MYIVVNGYYNQIGSKARSYSSDFPISSSCFKTKPLYSEEQDKTRNAFSLVFDLILDPLYPS